jgi:hypothetical protein
MTTTFESIDTTEDDQLVWVHDPVDLGLQASRGSRDTPDERPPLHLCMELGRRLLLAELEFSDWVARRVECVHFERDRSVSRKISVEFVVRNDAPVFVTRNGRRVFLVPLSIMRRRTLVNFNMEDETGGRLPMLGLRFTQQLDASMLFAAAATASLTQALDDRVKEFIVDVVAGAANTVDEKIESFSSESPPAHLEFLTQNALFLEILHRLHRNFTLYACLDAAQGLHRILNLSFDEPTYWRLQHANFPGEGTAEVMYEPNIKVSSLKRFGLHMSTKLGLKATRFRFQAPAAENAASYHFEATAPPGVRIVQASLLAGRPHEPKRHLSADRIVGHKPVVGLHAVEIPNNSLCRAQIDLRVPCRGWLAQLVTSCALIFAVLLSVVIHWPAAPRWSEQQLTNVVLILVSASAATATLVAQRDFHGLGAYMVTHLRAIGVMSLLLPILAAGYIVYEGSPRPSPAAEHKIQIAMLILLFAAGVFFIISLCAFGLSWWGDRVRDEQTSPWDMTAPREPTKESAIGRRRGDVLERDYWNALRRLKFNSPAIGIQSAEGWHHKYSWTDPKQQAAVKDLDKLRIKQDVQSRKATCTYLDPGTNATKRCPGRCFQKE